MRICLAALWQTIIIRIFAEERRKGGAVPFLSEIIIITRFE